MIRLFAIVLLLAGTTLGKSIEPPAPRGAAVYPTKPVTYRHKGWRYEYSIENAGTRSERRTGRLFFEDKEIAGQVGELKEEFLGRFIYFDTAGYNRGWLNTLTYNRAVFDKDFKLTNAANELLRRASR